MLTYAAMTPFLLRRPQAAFTLLEVMVVLFIIGLLMSLVSFTSSDRQAQDATERFASQLVAQLNQYQEEAAYQNIDLGLAMDEDELELLSYQDLNRLEVTTGKTSEELGKLAENPWQPWGSATIGTPAVPEGITLHLNVEGQEVDFEQLQDDDTGALPALLFLSSEEYTPFDLELHHDADSGFSVLIHGDGINPVWQEIVRYED